MKHYDDNYKISFEMTCQHPDGLKSGCCPIG